MGTVYKTKDGHIFSSAVTFEAPLSGYSYAVEASDEENIKCYALRELATMASDEFDFIMRYLKGYDQSDDVAALDDLACLIGNDCNEEKLTRLTEFFGSDPANWEKQHDNLLRNLFERAITDYKFENS